MGFFSFSINGYQILKTEEIFSASNDPFWGNLVSQCRNLAVELVIQESNKKYYIRASRYTAGLVEYVTATPAEIASKVFSATGDAMAGF